MKLSYKRDMTHNYMVPDIAGGVCEEDYRIRMLLENHILGLLPCSLKKVNCQTMFFFDITSKQSMEHIYEKGKMSAEDIRIFLRGLHLALKELKKYLLDTDRLVLEPQMIYMDIESREPAFCYLPSYQQEITQSFREIAGYILEHLDPEDEQAVLLGYELYRRAGEENYSLEQLLKRLGSPIQVQRAQSGAEPERTPYMQDRAEAERA
ncbi:MAG: DUF6382 domain-containing protein, partial [Eubacteriales bacterium]|nr:DUF6382 domain-containing protein [Eubacteriales bacterium]